MGRMRSPVVVVALVLAAVFAFMPNAQAQTTGRIEGKVVDSTGGALPGATITVASPALQGVRTVVTDSTGAFRFPALPPGKYSVKAELSGMKTTEQNDVVVGIATSGRTPYVLGAVKHARSIGAYTIGLSCNVDSELDAAVTDAFVSPSRAVAPPARESKARWCATFRVCADVQRPSDF